MRKFTAIVNGQKRTALIKDNELLLDVLREKLGVKSVKAACWRGECGLCTVLLNGELAKSCLVLAVEANSSEIITAEGLAKDGNLSELQEAFVRFGASQCGFCTPAFVVTCTYMLNRKKEIKEEEIKDFLSGIICRCGTYNQMKEAILALKR